jgi:hypothetical protein
VLRRVPDFYFASLLIRYGESVKVVQARLGHASATETLDPYSHLWPDSEDQTRTAIEVCFWLLSQICVRWPLRIPKIPAQWL